MNVARQSKEKQELMLRASAECKLTRKVHKKSRESWKMYRRRKVSERAGTSGQSRIIVLPILLDLLTSTTHQRTHPSPLSTILLYRREGIKIELSITMFRTALRSTTRAAAAASVARTIPVSTVTAPMRELQWHLRRPAGRSMRPILALAGLWE